MFTILNILLILFCSKNVNQIMREYLHNIFQGTTLRKCIPKFMLEDVNEIFSPSNGKTIDTHDCDVASSTQILSTTMSPCYDTPGCKLPLCCGVESGRITNISFVYVAPFDVTSMTTSGLFDSVGTGLGPPDTTQIKLIAVKMPNLIAPYDPNSCSYTVCPQTAGNIYRFDGIFSIPLSAVTTLTVTGNFIGQLTSNDPANRVVFCKAVYARIVNPNFIPDLVNILGNPPFG